MKIGLQGASGRTGSKVIEVIGEFPGLSIGAALIEPGSEFIGAPCADTGVTYSSDFESALQNCDAFIDFSTVDSSLALAAGVAKLQKPLLIATTGHSEKAIEQLKEHAKTAPILLASNTSLGVFALHRLIENAQEILGPDFRMEISEIHHEHKVDAPSGTAKTLAAALNKDNKYKIVTDRSSIHQARDQFEIGVSSIRGGDVAGEHTVYFIGKGERIEVAHKATDRSIFARGALRLIQRLHTKPNGFYTPTNLY
ncbi:MAG: 4-hydroxy-tetrahydrodipicolinate reductase [Deltaproteobacteria bacterium]|nr:4-hydroxy-tetrahydrodipicolinate reductase [Deltaproteobacteria bacterium]